MIIKVRKFQNIIEIKKNKEKFIISFEDIDCYNFEIRNLKEQLISDYFSSLKLSSSFKDHLFNNLFLYESEIHKNSCLLYFLLNNKIDPDFLSASFLSNINISIYKNYFSSLKEIRRFKSKINYILSIFSNLAYVVHRKIINKKLLKYFSNSTSIYNTKIKYQNILRANMELFEKLYVNFLKQSLNNTLILIEPSLVKTTFRQENYIKILENCRRNYLLYLERFSFFKSMGLLLRILFSSIPNDIKIPYLETILQRKYVDNLIKTIQNNFPKVNKFYMAERINPEKTYLTEKLKELKIKVIAYAHGVGVICPKINYDLFFVYSKFQQKYYIGETEYKFYNFNLNLDKIEKFEKKIALLFVCQNLFTYNKFKYLNSYKKVISYIEELARDIKIPVFAKYHPGSTQKDKVLSEIITIIDNLSDLPLDYNYLSITLTSSFVIELLKFMPFLIINPHNKINMNYIFPRNNFFIVNDYNQLKAKIEIMAENLEYYYDYWTKLIKNFIS